MVRKRCLRQQALEVMTSECGFRLRSVYTMG